MKKVIAIISILFIFYPVLVQSQENINAPQIINSGLEKQTNINKKTTSNNTKQPSKPTISASKKNSQAPTNGNTKKESTNHSISEPVSNSGWNTPSNILNLCLVVITFGMFVTTIAIVVITHRTSKRQLRAYVSARLEDGKGIFLDKNCCSVPLIIENHGQTPAHNFKSSCFVSVYKEPLQDTFDAPAFKKGSIAILAPGQKLRLYPTLPLPLDDATIQAIQNKENIFYVWGYLEYSDIFNHTQTVSFRMYATGEDFFRGELAYYKEGNSAT